MIEYKKLIKELIHPVGLVNYSFYNKQDIIELTDVTPTSYEVSNVLSGRVNVGNGMVVVSGSNTKYNISNALGILSLGSSIAVNGELRTINSIVSNIDNENHIISLTSSLDNNQLEQSNDFINVRFLTTYEIDVTEIFDESKIFNSVKHLKLKLLEKCKISLYEFTTLLCTTFHHF